MQCLILLFALLSALTLAYPSNISARGDDLILIHCDTKDFNGHCDFGKYDRCTPLLMVIRSLSVQEGYRCVLYDEPECRVTDTNRRYVGDRYQRQNILDVDFRIMSVLCRPAPSPPRFARAIKAASPSTLRVHGTESRSNIASRVDVDSTTSANVDWSLIICSSNDFQDSCDRGYYESCTGVGAVVQVQSLSVREGIECEFYAESACKTYTGGVVHIGNRQNRVNIDSVHFPIWSFKCHHFARRREANDATVSERGPTTEVCREGEVKCTGNSLQSGAIN